MKTILGLDLGTTSIGWALVKEDDNNALSKIIKAGVRVLPLSTDEKTDFSKGKAASINADRTLKRGARRNLDRYQLRRKNLLEVLSENKLIDANFVYAENGKDSTFSTYKIRTKAANERVELHDLAKVLLAINKKRGYKSSRKTKTSEEGQAIDGMAIAKRLYEEDLTPGQLVLELLHNKRKQIPDFYSSDLKTEFDKVWACQKTFYPEILTDEFKTQLRGKSKQATAKIFLGKYKIFTAENKGNKEEQKLKHYTWRSDAISKQLSIEELAYVLSEINNNLNASSGYLGEISDRSKELYFNKQTVGEYLYSKLEANPHKPIKNQVFYRQDYLDEFEKIWETQAQFHDELTGDLKKEIRDVVIFYQRKLKSQKHLVSHCEFEEQRKVCPKTSLLFQEFKIWQNLNNLGLKQSKSGIADITYLDLEARAFLFEELNIKGKLKNNDVLKLLGFSTKDYDLNFEEIEGNNTNKKLYEAYLKILELEGMDKISMAKNSAKEIKNAVRAVFENLGIKTEILDFDSSLSGNSFDKQASMQLWHLLYSADEDEPLRQKLIENFGFPKEYVNFLVNLDFKSDYGNLSARAIRKLLPHLKEGKQYDVACQDAGYGSHSKSKTKEEQANKILGSLDLLPKNSLHNPVVEKILNQMINVINAVILEFGKPDEIRIELARDLKQNAKERENASSNIAKSTRENEAFRKIIQQAPFNVKNPTRNDLIRYRLYEELEPNGYKTPYSNTYIPAEKLFSKEFDIEHIIAKATLFDDSFSNKTLELRSVNGKKGKMTAYDFVSQTYSAEEFQQYVNRVENLFNNDKNDKRRLAKYKNLMMTGDKIPDGFIDRELRNTQYIAKKAKELLEHVVQDVTTTTGSITSRLRDDWGLINIMQELNFDKYKLLGLTEKVEKKDGSFKDRIKDWSKRNDHRHHAMDAITVAFTRPVYVQYLNYLNAKDDDIRSKTLGIYGIEAKYLAPDKHDSNKKKFIAPYPHFRSDAREALGNIFVSFKAKNKVMTQNTNWIKQKNKNIEVVQLTPRGQLHKETVYGKIQLPVYTEEKIGGSFDEEKIAKVVLQKERNLLLERLRSFGNDPKKAFTGKNSLEKNPIYMDKNKTIKLSEKVRLLYFEDTYTTRKEVSPDLKLDKIVDKGVQTILKNRLEEYGGDPKKAFSDLDNNPIWLDNNKSIEIKRVTLTGVSNVEALHYKKDHLGNPILDAEGDKIPVDFVSPGNNHHVAVYRDEKGNLQEELVSFFEAVERRRQGASIVNKNHKNGWKFLFTMKQNEYFVVSDDTFNAHEVDLMNPINRKEVSKHLYRVQKISTKDYHLRHHLETSVENRKELKDIAYICIWSSERLKDLVKVRINHLGEIVSVGEY